MDVRNNTIPEVAATFNASALLSGSKPTAEEVKAMVQQAVDSALASPLFTGDIKLVNNALKALAIPDPYARFRKQFKDVATRNLLADAKADEHGNIRKPSTEAINAEIERLIANLKVKHQKRA